MATYRDFTDAIDRLFNLTITHTTLQLNSISKEKAFEVYILALTAIAIERAGGNFAIYGVNSGKDPNPVIFRAAPGAIYSSSQNFCYLKCYLNRKSFELHVDVEFEGKSGATHEIDISALEETHAESSRQGRRNPKRATLIIECKFYSNSIPSIGLARSLVGLMTDFNITLGSIFISNGATDNLKNFLSRRNRPDPFTDITPMHTNTEERLITALETKLRKWASI